MRWYWPSAHCGGHARVSIKAGRATSDARSTITTPRSHAFLEPPASAPLQLSRAAIARRPIEPPPTPTSRSTNQRAREHAEAGLDYRRAAEDPAFSTSSWRSRSSRKRSRHLSADGVRSTREPLALTVYASTRSASDHRAATRPELTLDDLQSTCARTMARACGGGRTARCRLMRSGPAARAVAERRGTLR